MEYFCFKSSSSFLFMKRGAAVALLLTSLVACSDSPDSKPKPPTPPPLVDPEITLYGDHFSLTQGESYVFDLHNVVKKVGDVKWKAIDVSEKMSLGVARLNTDSSFVFEGRDVGVTTIDYSIEDSLGEVHSSELLAVIKPSSPTFGNLPPFAKSLNFTISDGKPISFDLMDSVLDPDGDELSISTVSIGSEKFTVNDSVVTYDPADFIGVETMAYAVEDTHSEYALATVTVTVLDPHINPENQRPTAKDYQVTVNSEQSESFNFDLNKLGLISDADGDAVSVQHIISNDGRVEIVADNEIKYAPNGFTGIDQFTYVVEDEHGLEAIGSFVVVVENGTEGFQPVVLPIEASAHYSQPIIIDLKEYISDGDTPLDELVLTKIVGATSPATVVENNMMVTYTSNGWVGHDSLKFYVSDGLFLTEGNISITIDGDEDHVFELSELNLTTTPKTEADVNVSLPVMEGVTFRLSDVTQGALGSAKIDGNKIVYTPDGDKYGEDTITYTVTDSHIPAHSQTALLKVKVISVPDVVSPITKNIHYAQKAIVNLADYITDLDTPISSISIQNVSEATAPATVTLVDKTLTYDANGRIGLDTITFDVSDGEHVTHGVVEIRVKGDDFHEIVLPKPVIDEETNYFNAFYIDIPLPEGGGETYRVSEVTDGKLGTPTIRGDARIYYQPDEGKSGLDTFTYTITDDHLPSHSKSGVVNVMIKSAAPSVSKDIAIVTNDRSPVVLDLEDYVSDGDTPFGQLRFSNLTSDVPLPAEVRLQGAMIVFAPNFWNGRATVSFDVTDGEHITRGVVPVNVALEPIKPFNIREVVKTYGQAGTVDFVLDTRKHTGITFDLCRVVAVSEEFPDGCEILTSVFENYRISYKLKNLVADINSEFYIKGTAGQFTQESQRVTIPDELVLSFVKQVRHPNPDEYDRNGNVIAFSADGQYLATGIPSDDSKSSWNGGDNSGENTGAAVIWSQKGGSNYIKPSRIGNCYEFGSSLAISGNGEWFVAGAQRDLSTKSTRMTCEETFETKEFGRAYLFRLVNGDYYQKQELRPSDIGENDRFGYAIAISGDGSVVAISATGGIHNVYSDSRVYIYDNVNGVLTQSAILRTSTSERDNGFGHSLALNKDGSILVVGAITDHSNADGINGDSSNNDAQYSGAVYAYKRSGVDWIQTAYIKSSNSDYRDRFGMSLSLSENGSVLAVSATGEKSNAVGIDGDQFDNSLDSSGAVYIFEQETPDNWIQTSYIKPSDNVNYKGFAKSISINKNGTHLAVGSTGKGGHVYLFKKTDGVWEEYQILKNIVTGYVNNFGSAVAWGNDIESLAVGASSYRDDYKKVEIGNVFIY